VPKFLEAVPASFAITSASQPKSALSLINRATKNSPEHFAAALGAVTGALNHESAEVQEIAVDLLVKWKEVDPSLDLGALMEAATFLVPHLRQRVEQIAGNQMSGGSVPPDDARIPNVSANELD